MPGWSIHSRPPRGQSRAVTIGRDPDILRSFLDDAAHFPGGHASGLVVATSETDIADTLRLSRAVLPIGAQSSLYRRCDADGRGSPQHVAPEPLSPSGPTRSASRRASPGRPARGAGRSGPLLPADADLYRRVRRGTVRKRGRRRNLRDAHHPRPVSAMTVVLPGGDVLGYRTAPRAHP